MGQRVDLDCAVNTENHLEKEILDTRLKRKHFGVKQRNAEWF